MGKVFNSMIMGVIITAALYFINGNGADPTSLFSMLLNPTNFTNNAFWLIFAGITALGSIIVIGLAAIIKQDWVARAGMMAALSTIVLAPYLQLFTFFAAQTGYISIYCASSPVCSQTQLLGGIGQWVALVFAGPLFLYAMWAIIEFIWKGDSF